MITFHEFLNEKNLLEVGNGKHGGNRVGINPSMIGSVRAVNPARDVIPFPPGPMKVKGSSASAGKMKKPRSGVIGK